MFKGRTYKPTSYEAKVSKQIYILQQKFDNEQTCIGDAWPK